MKELVVLTEEPTGEILFRELARRLGFDGKISVFKHAGIGELKNSVSKKLAVYPNRNAKFLIVFDQDNADCIQRKTEFYNLIPADRRSTTKLRVACREVESWILAQPSAAMQAGILKKNYRKH